MLRILSEILSRTTSLSLMRNKFLYSYYKIPLIYLSSNSNPKRFFVSKRTLNTLQGEAAELSKKAMHNLEIGRYHDALNDFLMAHDLISSFSEEDDHNLAKSFENIGVAYYYLQNFDQAMEYLKKALNIFIRKKDTAPLDLANIYNNLGALLEKQGKLDGAIHFLGKSLDIYTGTKGEKDVNTAKALINLGSLYFKQGNYRNAEDCFEEGVSIYQSLGEEHRKELSELHSRLGHVKFTRGKFDEALQNLETAVEELEKDPVGNAHELYLSEVVEFVINKKQSTKSFVNALKYEVILNNLFDIYLLRRLRDISYMMIWVMST